MAGLYSFGSQVGDGDDTGSDSLSDLLTYGAKPDDETTGQPNGAPNVKSDASAPIVPTAHVAAVSAQPATAAPSATPASTPAVNQPPTYTPTDRTRIDSLTAQKAKDEVVSNVSPKWWERTLGGLTAGAMAFGRVPGAVEAGQAVTNRGQNAAELQRMGRLKADDVAIQAWQDGQQGKQQDFQNQNTVFNDNERAASRRQLDSDRSAQEQQRLQGVAPGTEQPDDPNNPLGTWHAMTVGGKKITLQGPPDKWANSAIGKETIEKKRREDLVTANHLSGDEAKYVRVNGKLKEPGAVTNVRVPSEGQQAYNEALSTWKRDNPGKRPSLSDLRTIRSAADGRADTTAGSTSKPIPPATAARISDTKNNEIRLAQEAYNQSIQDGTADKAQYIKDLQDAQDKYEQAIEAAGGTVNHMAVGDDLQWKSAAQPQPASTPAPSAAAAPQKAPKPNTPLKDPAIAKAYIRAAGGDKAKARAAAAKDGWQF